VHGLGVNHKQVNHAVVHTVDGIHVALDGFGMSFWAVDNCATTVASISNATPIGGQMDPDDQALPFGEGLWAVPLAAL